MALRLLPAKLQAGRLPRMLAVRARCASRASASSSSILDFLHRSCTSKLDALAALDTPGIVGAANEAGEFLGALHNCAIKASKRVDAESKRADEASKRADEASKRADAESKRADAESKRADLVALEFAGYQARASSKRETRQLFDQCLSTMGFAKKVTDPNGNLIPNPSATQLAKVFACTLLRKKPKGRGKCQLELADPLFKDFVQKQIGFDEADLASFMDTDLYPQWCSAYHSAQPLTTLAGITIDEEDVRLGLAKFLIFCKVRRDPTMSSTLRDCAVNLRLKFTDGKGQTKVKVFQYDHDSDPSSITDKTQ
jgi:hypothetical protein